MCFRQHLNRVFSVRRRAGIGICSPACSVVTDRVICCYLSFVNIHIFVSLCLCVHSRLLCRGRVPVFLCSYVTGCLSLSFPRYHLLFGSRPRWSRLVSPRTRVVTRQRNEATTQAQKIKKKRTDKDEYAGEQRRGRTGQPAGIGRTDGGRRTDDKNSNGGTDTYDNKKNEQL